MLDGLEEKIFNLKNFWIFLIFLISLIFLAKILKFIVIFTRVKSIKITIDCVLPDFPCGSFLPGCWWGFFSELGGAQALRQLGEWPAPSQALGDLKSPGRKYIFGILLYF